MPSALFISTLCALTVSTNAAAHVSSECSIDLQNGVTISDNFVKVFNKDKTLYQIERNGSLTINGQPVELTTEQQNISADYAHGLRQVVPDAVNIALEAVDVAATGVSTAFTALFGENSDIEHKVMGLVDRTRDKINENLHVDGNDYTISPNSFENLENAFDQEFEEEIESLALNSMGSIFSLMGEAMQNGDGNFEQRMQQFAQKMEKLGDDIEATVEAQAERLETKAEHLCQQLKSIDELETQLQNQVPQFAKHELLDMR